MLSFSKSLDEIYFPTNHFLPHLIQSLSSRFSYKRLFSSSHLSANPLSHYPQPQKIINIVGLDKMASTSSALSPATFVAAATVMGSARNPSRKRVVYMRGLNSFGGLKSHNNIASLGVPKWTTQCFAMVLSSLQSPSQGKGKGGGALSSTCNASAEIFKIAAIMNVLVLIGVAVGFVLLRIEATLEEE